MVDYLDYMGMGSIILIIVGCGGEVLFLVIDLVGLVYEKIKGCLARNKVSPEDDEIIVEEDQVKETERENKNNNEQ